MFSCFDLMYFLLSTPMRMPMYSRLWCIKIVQCNMTRSPQDHRKVYRWEYLRAERRAPMRTWGGPRPVYSIATLRAQLGVTPGLLL